jgi:CSLREA domain-containing protein
MSRAPLLAVLSILALAAPAGAATTIVPDTFDDQLPADCSAGHPAGTCSLREAVTEAQDGDRIQLAEGTYALQLNELLVDQDVTFVGAGPSKTIIQQHATGKRVLEFDVGTTASMSGLTITGGNLVGSDGANETMVTPVQDGGGAYGGAINARGTALTLTLVDIVGNSTTGGKGGNGLSPGSGAGHDAGDGGSASSSAIDGTGNVTLDRVTVADNVAHGGNGGNGGNGSGSGDGGVGGKGGPGSGAIGGGSGMVLVVRDSTISGNTGFAGTGGHGGNGGAGPGGSGGDGGRSVRGTGGGIFSNGDVTIVNSTITVNEIHGGTGGDGGSGVFAGGGNGGYAESGLGGGVSLLNAGNTDINGHIASSTIANNSVFAGTGGAGGFGLVSGADGDVGLAFGGNLAVYSDKAEIRDSVIVGGVASSASSTNCDVGGGEVTSHGYNVEDKNQCIPTPATGDRHDIDAKLGPLQENGGPTKTMAPLGGSPIINGGPAVCQGDGTPLTTDQRGMPRDAACDNGAYEAIAPAVGMRPAVGGSPVTGKTVTCVPGTFTGDAPQTIETAWLRDGQQVATGTDYPIPAGDAGHELVCRQTATNAYGSATGDSIGVAVTAAPTPAGGNNGGATPTISNLKIKPKTLHRRTKAKVTFTLSAPARVTFKLCKRKGKKCKRVKKGAPKALQGKQGANRVTLKAKGLKRGRYRLTATPAGGKGARVSFRVVQ